MVLVLLFYFLVGLQRLLPGSSSSVCQKFGYGYLVTFLLGGSCWNFTKKSWCSSNVFRAKGSLFLQASGFTTTSSLELGGLSGFLLCLQLLSLAFLEECVGRREKELFFSDWITSRLEEF